MTSKSASSWMAGASTQSPSACSTAGGGTGGGTGDGAADRRRGQKAFCASSDPTFGGDCSSQSDAAPRQSSHRRRHGKAPRAKHGTPPQAKPAAGKKRPARCPPAEQAPAAPPLWSTTVRVAPQFAGVVPYDPSDASERLDGVADAPTIACTDSGLIIYVGMFTDLRERLELMQRTLDFEGYSLVTEHQRHRNLAEEGDLRQRRMHARLKRLAQQVDERKDRLGEWNMVLRRKPQAP